MVTQFRKSFDFSKLSKDLNHWFPGHMAKGLRRIHEHLYGVDAVVEVHDARVSFFSFFKLTLLLFSSF